MKINGEFKGRTEERLKTIDRSICELKTKVEQFDKRLWAILWGIIVLVTLLAPEKLNNFTKIVLAGF